MKRYLVWTRHSSENWTYDEADTWDETIKLRDQQMMTCPSEDVIVTEHVPLIITDGRLKK